MSYATALVVVGAIAGIAVLYVLVPAAAAGLMQYRGVMNVRCPAEGHEADVTVTPASAALSEFRDHTGLRVATCSNWPGRRGCDEACVAASARGAPAK